MSIRIMGTVLGIAVVVLTVVVAVRWMNSRFIAPSAPLHEAAFRGNLHEVRLQVRSHPARLNVLASFMADSRLTTLTPLMWSVRGGHHSVVEELLTLGADTNVSDAFGRTALWFAVEDGRVEIVRTLLRANADPNSVTTFGSTPLVCALTHQNIELAEMLIQAGADPNAWVQRASTLEQIVVAGHPESVRVLLEHGAKIRTENERARLILIAKKLWPESAAAIERILSQAKLVSP